MRLLLATKLRPQSYFKKMTAISGPIWISVEQRQISPVLPMTIFRWILLYTPMFSYIYIIIIISLSLNFNYFTALSCNFNCVTLPRCMCDHDWEIVKLSKIYSRRMMCIRNLEMCGGDRNEYSKCWSCVMNAYLQCL